jgi:YfiR/HmsC-like
MKASGLPFGWAGKLERAVVAALVLGAAVARAQPEPPSPTEYEVKAAFLYNFTRFVEWPSEALRDPGASFVIAIVGRDPFGAVLDETVAGKTAGGRPIEVRRVPRVEEAREAQIVFVSSSERSNIAAILKELERPGILTVGDTDGFAMKGGAINFTMQARKVRFEINPVVTEQAGLKVSSQLLKLATLVAGPRS